MKKKVVGLIRKIIYNAVRSIATEVYLQQKEKKENVIANSKLDALSKIYPPYRIIDSEIGKYSYLAEGSKISMSSIGKFCSIGPNFLCGWGIHPTNGLSTSPMFYSTLKQNGKSLSLDDKIVERASIRIGNDVFIGANVVVLDGVTIGDGAIIGAGAVVSKDIPPYAIAVGCPIKILKFRFSEVQIKKLLEIKWWDFTDERLVDVEKYFFLVDDFLQNNRLTK